MSNNCLADSCYTTRYSTESLGFEPMSIINYCCRNLKNAFKDLSGHQMMPTAEFNTFLTFSRIMRTQKMWNASRFCVSSLRRGHANLLCIVPILVYAHPKVDKVRKLFLSYIDIHFLGLLLILNHILLFLFSCIY